MSVIEDRCQPTRWGLPAEIHEQNTQRTSSDDLGFA
jgi:hypothetical protein